MSVGSKVFLGSSLTFAIGAIWGVHWLQKREQDNMYLGVVRDEQRTRDKASARLGAVPPLNTPSAPIQRPLGGASSSRTSPPYRPASSDGASSSSSSRSTPIGGVGLPQPAAVIDEDCQTCVVSPPPELQESQSADMRRRDREERLAEYESQKALAERLEMEQGVSDHQTFRPDQGSQRLV